MTTQHRIEPQAPERSEFATDFLWGCATSSYQIEGAGAIDGRVESIWDRFAATPGKVRDGSSGAVACDHYHRWPQDLDLLKSMGVDAYRFSIAWPRVMDEQGRPNERGIDFYKRLLDGLAERGMRAFVTLYHWDLPQWLEDRGGWCERLTVDAFGRYADTIVSEFSGKVKNWITLNEIRCFTRLAYAADAGNKAPGRPVSKAQLNQTYHHALLCHGHGVRAVRAYGGPGARVGLTDNCEVSIPVTETTTDIAAAKAWFIDENIHLLGAIHAGRYEPSYLARVGSDAPRVSPGDFDLISLPTDYLGLNIYTGSFLRADRNNHPEVITLPAHYPKADSPWLHLAPQAIYWATRFVREVYGVKEIYITENGCGYNDEPVVNGEVNDLHRRDFLRSYLRETHRAIADGVPVHGYFLWSFMDNFEWEDGYLRRFGIIHVDFATQRRTPKLSARYYASVMRENRIV